LCAENEHDAILYILIFVAADSHRVNHISTHRIDTGS
jgi:hypothetical protein